MDVPLHITWWPVYMYLYQVCRKYLEWYQSNKVDTIFIQKFEGG